MRTDPPLADPTSRLPALHAASVKANTLAIASDPTAVPRRPAATPNAHAASTPRSTHAPTAPLPPRVCPQHSHPGPCSACQRLAKRRHAAHLAASKQAAQRWANRQPRTTPKSTAAIVIDPDGNSQHNGDRPPPNAALSSTSPKGGRGLFPGVDRRVCVGTEQT
jgi:hypothetical protein